MLTHGNMISTVTGFLSSTENVLSAENSAYLSYLPLAHCYERTVLHFALASGARVGFYQGVCSLTLLSLNAFDISSVGFDRSLCVFFLTALFRMFPSWWRTAWLWRRRSSRARRVCSTACLTR